jgi:integrating conjugative element protein (TIGR03752 family)
MGDTPIDALARAFGNASDTVGRLSDTLPDKLGGGSQAGTRNPPASNAVPMPWAQVAPDPQPNGAISYKLMPPMGYAVQTAPAKGAGQGGVAVTRFVRTTVPGNAGDESAGNGPAARAAQAAAAGGAKKPEPIPYFTIPENATLAGVTAMTSLIGRVPIDGRVTDPMQFKAIVGRDNLAANGWELPDDLAGMIVTGVAIGDMALSCSEGKVRSITFVFDDGAIRTISARRAGGTGGGGLAAAGGSGIGGGDLGFISDEHGNPCVQGTFVTNAPAYLTDIVGVKSLGLAAHSLAEAQRTTTTSALTGTATSSLTGSASSFALGQAAAGATDEITNWLTQRLKNSFDAVVTPSGAKLVVHLDREIAIDKDPSPRKIVHRTQASANAQNGTRYGLE